MSMRSRALATAVAAFVLVVLGACAPLPMARLLGGREVVSEGPPGGASLSGRVVGAEACLDFEGPVVVVLRGPGLPPGGVVSTPLDPWAEEGNFRFPGLQPGTYALSLRPPPGQTRHLFRSAPCDLTVLVEPGEVVVDLKEGEAKEVTLELVYVKNSPEVPLASPWGIPALDPRSTDSGVSFTAEELQGLPIPPASTR